jgi:hypothetical protein
MWLCGFAVLGRCLHGLGRVLLLSQRHWGTLFSMLTLKTADAYAGHWYDRALVTAAGCLLWACTTAGFGAAGSLAVRCASCVFRSKSRALVLWSEVVNHRAHMQRTAAVLPRLEGT